MKKLTKIMITAVLAMIVVLAASSFAFADSTALTITNNTGMFKAVAASLEEEAGKEYLTISLNGTGYKHLFKGTYEEAVENGAAFDNWIDGYEADVDVNGKSERKWTFQIPLTNGESFIPVVAISEREYQNYLSGTTTLEKAFYPRQAEVDRAAKTLVTDDYNETAEFTVISNVADFKVAEKSSTKVVGGPNSNNYSIAPTLVMKDTTYDEVTYPTVVNGEVSTVTTGLSDGRFIIAMTNAPNKEAFKDKTPIEMRFHVSSKALFEEAGSEVVRNVTIDKMAKTITVDGDELTPVPKKNTTISIVNKSNVKTVKAGGKKLKKNVTFTVKTKASSGAKTNFKKTSKGKIAVAASGKVTLKKGLKKGKYTVKVTVSAKDTATYKAASRQISIKVTVK